MHAVIIESLRKLGQLAGLSRIKIKGIKVRRLIIWPQVYYQGAFHRIRPEPLSDRQT